jgi:hypothetical protein
VLGILVDNHSQHQGQLDVEALEAIEQDSSPQACQHT